MNDKRTKEMRCVECRKLFFFTAWEQNLFKKMGYTDPKRCLTCRKKRREKKNPLLT